MWCRSCSNKQKQEKIPKRIRKAEREKEKRGQLNELFLGLADTLGNLILCHH